MDGMRSALAVLVLAFAACGDDGGSANPDARIVNGCPALEEPQASPGDPIDGDTWDTYAQQFFADWCTRCHASTLSGADRNGAPTGFDWDVEASVRAQLPRIRNAVGVLNFMPFTPPDPPCEERARIVRWIDAAAP
jgi:uncharacterized membrane protein